MPVVPMPFVPLLARVNFSDPIVWAVLLAWILSVVLHELAHGIVGFLGGDHTIRDRGGLTLNPLQYVHPVNSILLPAIFLMMGGIPLPGGATYIRRDLLRNRLWEPAVSLAGPATNFLLFALLMWPLHPTLGWLHPSPDGVGWTSVETFLATLGTLQFITAMFNLIPIPPLDGFGAISPLLPPEIRAVARQPQVATFGLFAVFIVLRAAPGLTQQGYNWEHQLLTWAGMDSMNEGIRLAFNSVMVG